MATKPIRLDVTVIEEIENMRKEMNFNKQADVVKQLLTLSPFLRVLTEKHMTIEQAIAKLNTDDNVTEVRIISKGINEYALNSWKEKLIAYNDKCLNDEDKVVLTQQLFLDLIGGNVNSISKRYKADNEIKAHNAKLGLDDSHNRRLSSRIRAEYGTVADWIKARIG